MTKEVFKDFIKQAKLIFGSGIIPLHRPVFEGNDDV